MQLVTISSQRQITIPVYLLNQLGVDKKDKLFLSIEKHKLVAKPRKGSIINQLAGSLNHLVAKSKLKITTKEAIKQAKDIAVKTTIDG